MQFDDDIKSRLEAAAATPSRDVDPGALLREGKRLRRTRIAAAAGGMAIVVAAASAAFGILGSDEGPGFAAQPTPDCAPDDASSACLAERFCALPDRHEVSLFLRDGASRPDVDALRLELEASSDVASVIFKTKQDAYREFKSLYPGQPELWETMDPADLPATLRVRATDAEAAHRVAAIDRPFIDEARSSTETRERLCSQDRVPAPPPAPDETNVADEVLRELRPPFEVGLLRAECRTDTPGGSIEFTNGTKWCRFVLFVDNNMSVPLYLDLGSQRLRATNGMGFTPWEDGMKDELSSRLFDDPIDPDERAIGQVVFVLGPDAAPGALHLRLSALSDYPVTIPLDYQCSPDIRVEPDGRCFFAPTGSGL